MADEAKLVAQCIQLFFFNFFNIYLFFNWRIIALRNCVGFCQMLTWISHSYTYVPCLLSLPPTSHHLKVDFDFDLSIASSEFSLKKFSRKCCTRSNHRCSEPSSDGWQFVWILTHHLWGFWLAICPIKTVKSFRERVETKSRGMAKI